MQNYRPAILKRLLYNTITQYIVNELIIYVLKEVLSKFNLFSDKAAHKKISFSNDIWFLSYVKLNF